VTRRSEADRPRRRSSGGGRKKQTDQDKVHVAASAVEQAREALNRAEAEYRESLDHMAARAARARALTVGDIVDGTCEFVRRHPAAGLLTAGVLGFLLGKSMRR
jgi:ElaB/YqjD/DUF883 family membrane-anchored ribosome-binding protein